MSLRLPYEQFVLPNGLTVTLHRDPGLPLAAVNLWYYVGSKDEPPGRSGFAHLFEHLMFMGTERVPEGAFDRVMEEGGGTNNASTSRDRTTYHSSGPPDLLPTLLWLEADRMESLGRSMTQEKLDLQRNVVRNERRQSYENRPYGKAWLILPEMLHAEGHPYRIPVIGSHEDLVAATVEDVRDFFGTWYVPNNASLVVAGDFDPEEVRRSVEDLFGDIPPGAEPPHRSAPPARLERVVRRTITDAVPTPRVYMAWHSPPHFAPGDAEMDLLAGILSDGAGSRLQQALVHKRNLAQQVTAYQSSGQLGSDFYIVATPLPETDLDTLAAAVHGEVRRLLEEGPGSDEVLRNITTTEAAFVKGLQSLTERADAMNLYLDALGDAGAVETDLDRYRQATPESVRRWAREVLGAPQHAELRVIPEKPARRDAPAHGRTPLSRDSQPARGVSRPWAPQEPAVLDSGGREVWVLERHSVPVAGLQVLVPGGALDDPQELAGLNSLLAELTTEGAGDHDAASLDNLLDMLGTDLSVDARRTTFAFRISALSRTLSDALALLRKVMLEPRLAEEDFQRVRAIRVANLVQRRANPAQVAALVAMRALFGQDDPWGRPLTGFPESVGGIGLQEVREAHRRLMAGAGSGRLVLAGDVDAGGAGTLLEEIVEALPGGSPGAEPAPPAPRVSGSLRFHFVHREKAPQTVIRFLLPVPSLLAPESPALWLANTVFGGSFTSRLNLNLRERHGFTYGASSGLNQGRFTGVFAAASSVKAEATAPALLEFFAEFRRLRTGDISGQELAKALATLKAQAVRSAEDISGLTELYATFAAAGARPGDLLKTYERLETLSVEQVNEAASRYLDPGRGVLVLVGDRDQVLSGLGGMDLPDPVPVDEDGTPLERGS